MSKKAKTIIGIVCIIIVIPVAIIAVLSIKCILSLKHIDIVKLMTIDEYRSLSNTITIYKNGMITFENEARDPRNNAYYPADKYLKFEYKTDKASIDDLHKTIQDNYLTFFEKLKSEGLIFDGGTSILYVKCDDGSEYIIGGYAITNDRYNIIEDKVWDCYTFAEKLE